MQQSSLLSPASVKYYFPWCGGGKELILILKNYPVLGIRESLDPDEKESKVLKP